jgi:hypothetical protein
MAKRRILTVAMDKGQFTINLTNEVGGPPVSLLGSSVSLLGGSGAAPAVWLTPEMFGYVDQTLRENGCSDSQIRQVLEMLRTGKDANLELELPESI